MKLSQKSTKNLYSFPKRPHEKQSQRRASFKVGPSLGAQQRKCKIWSLGGLYGVQTSGEIKK